MDKSLSAAILAGGQGRRMEGKSKAGLPLGGEKIITRILNKIRGLFTEILIITNTPEEFSEYADCLIAGDLYPERGPVGGIHSALHHAHSDAVFVFAGDMPLLDKEMILMQISEYNSMNYDILVPRSGSAIEPLHAIYSRKILINLEEFILTGSGNAIRDFYCKVNTGFLDIKEGTDAGTAFLNINTPADLAEAERIIRDRRKNKL